LCYKSRCCHEYRGTFDAFIVFSESRWIGTAEENPDESKLDNIPAELKEIQEEEVLKDEEDVGDNDVENEGEEKSDDITREVIDLDDGDDDDGDDGSKKKRSSSRRRSGKILLPFFTNYACMQWPPPHK